MENSFVLGPLRLLVKLQRLVPLLDFEGYPDIHKHVCKVLKDFPCKGGLQLLRFEQFFVGVVVAVGHCELQVLVPCQLVLSIHAHINVSFLFFLFYRLRVGSGGNGRGPYFLKLKLSFARPASPGPWLTSHSSAHSVLSHSISLSLFCLIVWGLPWLGLYTVEVKCLFRGPLSHQSHYSNVLVPFPCFKFLPDCEVVNPAKLEGFVRIED